MEFQKQNNPSVDAVDQRQQRTPKNKNEVTLPTFQNDESGKLIELSNLKYQNKAPMELDISHNSK